MKLRQALLAILALGIPVGATAAEVSTEVLAAGCAACHGPEGRSPGAIPGIAGMPYDKLADSLKAFQAGTAESTVMTRLTKGFSDAELERLARYFAERKE